MGGGLGQFAYLRVGGGLAKKEGVVFLRGVDTLMHTISKWMQGFLRALEPPKELWFQDHA